ncbi:arginine deiminase family protein [Sphingomonas sp. DG1-23]|uniref:dimethylarginine dimethylaminohydrolase family protein n=1 Tax=Sphingomonas sp. DG1-23 TaxID=3068316 RepID=UPI00273FCA52|nr:arginine deiminase family protein [Sphingomonas sp. DG1-23]MDP5279217.1 arginine deiminase family protein [Sphingomonas sp. DG1-23]
MKLEFPEQGGSAALVELRPWQVTGETRRLTDVMLSRPDFLAPVPCCSVTRESLRDGFETDRLRALGQHRALQRVLEMHGVRCHFVPAIEAAPDLSFTRDVAVTTPWGLVALNPALPHRRDEVDCLVAAAGDLGAHPVLRIAAGVIEGGDVAVVRPGLVVIGCSGERTDAAGAAALAGLFANFGWEALLVPFDPHFLHLDTVFCMLDERTALACVDVLDDGFADAMAAYGIRLLPVSYKEARGLGCNILSIDGSTIVMAAGHDRVTRSIADAGFDPVAVDISEFTACGGGIHCLTMPLARIAD